MCFAYIYVAVCLESRAAERIGGANGKYRKWGVCSNVLTILVYILTQVCYVRNVSSVAIA